MELIKTNRVLPISALLLGLAGTAGLAGAAVPEQAAANLGKELTPVGAEKAGNKEGTIPEWKGGLPKGKHKLGDPRVDPFAADKPLFTIDAGNVDKYKDKLSAGQIELIKTRKGYRLDVYPTQRSCGYPDLVYAQTHTNALSAKISTDGKDNLASAVGGDSPSPSPRAAPRRSGITACAGRAKVASSPTRPTSSIRMAVFTAWPRINRP